MWWVKLIVIVLLLAAVFSLGRALMGLVQGDSKSGKTMRALACGIFGGDFPVYPAEHGDGLDCTTRC